MLVNHAKHCYSLPGWSMRAWYSLCSLLRDRFVGVIHNLGSVCHQAFYVLSLLVQFTGYALSMQVSSALMLTIQGVSCQRLGACSRCNTRPIPTSYCSNHAIGSRSSLKLVMGWRLQHLVQQVVVKMALATANFVLPCWSGYGNERQVAQPVGGKCCHFCQLGSMHLAPANVQHNCGRILGVTAAAAICLRSVLLHKMLVLQLLRFHNRCTAQRVVYCFSSIAALFVWCGCTLVGLQLLVMPYNASH